MESKITNLFEKSLKHSNLFIHSGNIDEREA